MYGCYKNKRYIVNKGCPDISPNLCDVSVTPQVPLVLHITTAYFAGDGVSPVYDEVLPGCRKL